MCQPFTRRLKMLVAQESHGMTCIPRSMVQQHMMSWKTDIIAIDDEIYSNDNDPERWDVQVSPAKGSINHWISSALVTVKLRTLLALLVDHSQPATLRLACRLLFCFLLLIAAHFRNAQNWRMYWFPKKIQLCCNLDIQSGPSSEE